MTSKTKQQIDNLLKELKKMKPDLKKSLQTQKHIQYVQKVLYGLGDSIIYFDVAQPWLYYYIIHALLLLGSQPSLNDKKLIKQALKHCWNQGFAGGSKQLAHLAPTYASFLAILELGPQAYDLIDRQALYDFFKRCKKGGKFQMHEEGQCDLRGSYIVIIITKLLNLKQDILEGVAETIIQSQTHQGGIANTVGGQAHGGFTFCGVAGLAALNRLHELDISRLMLWLTHRQVQFGGFNGRTSKLLDSCYSFWIGSVFNIVNNYFEGKVSFGNNLLYCQRDLRRYILLYCQDQKGGLFDKPGKPKDIYHTCYALSGLSLSQQGLNSNEQKDIQNKQINYLTKIDPIYNITINALKIARQKLSKDN